MSGLSKTAFNDKLILNSEIEVINETISSKASTTPAHSNGNLYFNKELLQQKQFLNEATVEQQILQQQHQEQQQLRNISLASTSQSLGKFNKQLPQQQTVIGTQLPSTISATVTNTVVANSNSPLNPFQTIAALNHLSTKDHKPNPGTKEIVTNTANKSPNISVTNLLQIPALQNERKFELNNIEVTDPEINATSRGNIRYIKHSKSLIPNLKGPAHSIPPRYRPPPLPANTYKSSKSKELRKCIYSYSNSGMNERTIRPVIDVSKSRFSDAFSFDYPPEIPQLTPILLPDCIKSHRNTSKQFSSNYRHHQILENTRDMLNVIRKMDQEHPSPNASEESCSTDLQLTTARLTAEQSRQVQSLINELRDQKEQNQRLLDDNQELRDLCCFLDDDRQKGRKLAREWQRFGRYTASVMRQEVAAYQNKLRQLDDKQQELITDNLELKELCLYLDEERTHISANTMCINCAVSTKSGLRDDGDGSSSSTNAEETISVALSNYGRQLPDTHFQTTFDDQTLQYVRSLERRIQQLEEERLAQSLPSSNSVVNRQYNIQNKQQELL